MITQSELAKYWGVTKGRISQLVKDGCPLNSKRAADLWRKNRGQKRAPTNSAANLQPECKSRGRPKKRPPASNTGDSLLDALNNSIAAATRAYEDFEHACVNSLGTRSMRLSEHSKAIEAQLKSEKAYRQEQERRDVLVDKQVIIERCRQTLDSVLRLIKKLPSETGPACNPQDQILAVRILQKATDSILIAGGKALRDL